MYICWFKWSILIPGQESQRLFVRGSMQFLALPDDYAFLISVVVCVYMQSRVLSKSWQ